ncbi:MAG: BrnT family toxin [Nitrospirae bacterium]|nr:BrnT family toxin [Nitrospirota bacterium]
MIFEWGEGKNKINIKKHRVSFEWAKEIFDDPLHISVLDKRFDYFEERWVTLGSTKSGIILVVGHMYYLTEEAEEVIKVITARKATKKEREQYEKIS